VEEKKALCPKCYLELPALLLDERVCIHAPEKDQITWKTGINREIILKTNS